MRKGWRTWGRRRKGAAVYSDRDKRTWNALARTAARVAADWATEKTGAMEHAARRAQVVMPPGWRDKDSPFLKLQQLGREWPSLDLAARQARAAELAALAVRCAEILSIQARATEQVREPRRRADIDD